MLGLKRILFPEDNPTFGRNSHFSSRRANQQIGDSLAKIFNSYATIQPTAAKSTTNKTSVFRRLEEVRGKPTASRPNSKKQTRGRATKTDCLAFIGDDRPRMGKDIEKENMSRGKQIAQNKKRRNGDKPSCNPNRAENSKRKRVTFMDNVTGLGNMFGLSQHSSKPQKKLRKQKKFDKGDEREQPPTKSPSSISSKSFSSSSGMSIGVANETKRKGKVTKRKAAPVSDRSGKGNRGRNVELQQGTKIEKTRNSKKRGKCEDHTMKKKGNGKYLGKKKTQTKKRSAHNNKPLRRSRRLSDTYPTRNEDATETMKTEAKMKTNIIEHCLDESDNNDSCQTDRTKSDNQTQRSTRKSKRKMVQPDRFGDFPTSEQALFYIDEAERMVGKRSSVVGLCLDQGSATEDSVPVQNEVEDHKKEHRMSEGKQPCVEDGWHTTDLIKLRRAHGEVNPQSVAFWDEIGEAIEGKSADECRTKWYSFVKTPVAYQRKTRILERTELVKEDDIFDATPMRGLFGMKGGDTPGFSVGRLSSLDLGSAIKVDRQEGDQEVPIPAQHGYKKFLKNMRRDVNMKIPKRKVPKGPAKLVKKITSRADEKDMVEMHAVLSPGGTLVVKSQEESDTFDGYFEDLDDDEEQE